MPPVPGELCKKLHALVLVGVLMPLLQVVQADPPEAGRVPSLSVGDLIDAQIDATVPRVAIRGQLISELVQAYECQVQTRWYGLEVLTEKTIDEMAYMDSLSIPADEIQTADYVISGHYAGGAGVSTTGHVYCAELKADGRRGTLRGAFGPKRTCFEIPECMAKTAANLLSLAPRRPPDGPVQAPQKELVWVVYPFLRCSPGWGTESFMDAKLALQVEAELQKQGIIKRLVDRQALDAILKEHHMASLTEKGHEPARKLARLTKADILLTGQVAPGEKNLRIDLYLLDSRTGCMIAACTAKEVTEEQLASECVRLAVLLAETPIVMSSPARPTPAQRRREAEVLISREHYPDHSSEGFYFTRVRSELESMINAAEGAYLLVHDEPSFVYRNVRSLWQGYKRWGWWNTPKPGDSIVRCSFRTLECMQRTACLMNQALQSMEHSPDTPTPLLLRADALMYAGRYKEAIPLAESHMKRYPAVEEGWALEILAESNYRLGNVDVAVDLAKRSIARKSDSWFTHDIVSDAVTAKMKNAVNSAAGKSDREAYEAYRELMYTEGAKIGVEDLKRYLELMRKVEGPEKSLDIAKITTADSPWWAQKFLLHEFPGQTFDPGRTMKCTLGKTMEGLDLMSVVMLHVACCYEAAGQKEKAVRRYKDIVADADTFRMFWDQHPMTRTARDEAEALRGKLERETGPVSELWRTGGEVRPFAGRYRIYLVPLADLKKTWLPDTVTNLVAFFGAGAVKVLPEIPVPNMTLPGGEFTYRCRPLFQGILKTLVVPDDALHVVILTDLPIEYAGVLCAGQAENFDNPRDLSPVLLSYHTLKLGYGPWPDRSCRLVAMRAATSLYYIYADDTTRFWRQASWRGYARDKTECRSWDCIFSALMQDPGAEWGARFSMCPECQKKYKEADFDKIHRDLISYLKSAGVKIVPAEKAREEAASPAKP